MDLGSQDELRQRAKVDLQDELPSREEAMVARCYVAHQLGQSLGEDHVRQPLALIDSEAKVKDAAELDGLQKQYVEAVRRNIQVRMKFAEVQEEHRKTMASLQKKKETESRILDLHMEVMRLQQRHDKQQVVIKYLEQLQQQPAASPGCLDTEVMYKGCSPLPEIPREMIDGFATDHSGTDAEVDELLQKLQKSVLRSKLTAKRDQQRFEQAQAGDGVDLSNLKPEAKLHALNIVKNTLINWIESQLGKAGDGGGADSEEESPVQGSTRKIDIEARLADIQKEYQRHIELRKEIVGLLAKRDQINLKQPHATEKTPAAAEAIRAPRAPPYAYLLAPYLEQLQILSQEQKSQVQEKSHINSTLSKRHEDTKKTLDHLVQESQLLHKYPAAKTSKPQLSFGAATRSSGKPSVVNQVQPWIYAADSAKIGTLETVAENLEEGMISIDESRQALEVVCKLLNVELPGAGSDPGQEDIDQDMWLQEGDDEKSKLAMKKENDNKDETEPPKNIWSTLDGNLGSINE
jgi:hypothetical protein